MFKRYVEYSKASFTTVKQDSKVATPATIAAMSFVYYATANDTTEEQKRAIPTFGWTNGMTNCHSCTGLNKRKVQRIFVKEENKPKWRLSELS